MSVANSETAMNSNVGPNPGAARLPGPLALLPQPLQTLYRRHETLVKYLLIGGTASAIDVILFLVLYNALGTSELLAHSVSVPTAVLFSFFVNARHNFRTHDRMALRLLSFAIVCLIGYLAGYGVILAVMAGGLDANIGKIVSLPVVFVIQYVLNSRITFRKGGPTTGRTARPAG